MNLPNGERQSIKHAETVRQKRYTIPGLSAEDAAQWVEIFTDNEGAQLVVVVDDEGATYPAFLNQQLLVNKTATRFDIQLEFTEVRL